MFLAQYGSLSINCQKCFYSSSANFTSGEKVLPDDTQAYLKFSPGDEEPAQSKIESHLNEVRNWIVAT